MNCENYVEYFMTMTKTNCKFDNHRVKEVGEQNA